MKVLVLGWVRMAGEKSAEKGGGRYDFAKLYVANQITEKVGQKSKRTGDGFEQGEIAIQEGCEGQFRGLKFPLVLELKLDHQMNFAGRLEPVVTGFIPPAALKTA